MAIMQPERDHLTLYPSFRSPSAALHGGDIGRLQKISRYCTVARLQVLLCISLQCGRWGAFLLESRRRCMPLNTNGGRKVGWRCRSTTQSESSRLYLRLHSPTLRLDLALAVEVRNIRRVVSSPSMSNGVSANAILVRQKQH